jgi:hypothetical protein
MQVAVRSYLTAGVAIVGATALVAAPITTSPPDIQVPGIHAAQVELAAVANPIEQWLQVFQGTVNNVVGIGGAVVADPAPVLRQVFRNQLGYVQVITPALTETADNYLTFLTQTVPTGLRQVATQIADGDINGAANTINGLVGGLLINALPLLPILSIPGQITDNLSNVVKALTSDTAVLTLASTALSPVEAIIAAAGASGQAFVDAVGAGDPVGAITTVINVPAVLTGALLNGFNNFPGLLTFNAAGGGLVQTLLVTLPQMVATAITPVPAPLATARVKDTPAGIGSVPGLNATMLSLDTSAKVSGAQTPGLDADPGAGTTPVDGNVDPGTEVNQGTDETETDPSDGQVTTTTTDPDPSTKPGNTTDGNKVVVPGKVNAGATGQGTPKSPVKQFGDQVKSFLGKLGFKPHTGKKTGAADSGTPAAATGSTGAADPGGNGSESGSGSGGSSTGGGE